MKTNAHYIQTARALLLANKTHLRAFDDCFENSNGDAVVRGLMQLAETDTPLFLAIRDHGFYDHWYEIADQDFIDFRLI